MRVWGGVIAGYDRTARWLLGTCEQEGRCGCGEREGGLGRSLGYQQPDKALTVEYQ